MKTTENGREKKEKWNKYITFDVVPYIYYSGETNAKEDIQTSNLVSILFTQNQKIEAKHWLYITGKAGSWKIPQRFMNLLPGK